MRTAHKTKQRGATMIVGIILVTVLLLAACVVGYLALTQKNEPQLTPQTETVSADDLLTTGKTTGDLTKDYRIIAAGLKRDDEQREAAKVALEDEVLPVGTGVTTSTNVEQARLSQLQTEFIKEVDRRLTKLDETSKKVSKLTAEQKTVSTKYISDEITTLTGLKTKAAAETAQAPLLQDRDALDAEHTNYRMIISQVYMLLWANDQRVLAEKANVLGGKFQERLNDASNHGQSIARGQTLLNSYQADKEAAKSSNETGLKLVTAVKPGTFEANKAVLQGYYNSLSAANESIKKTSDTSKEVIPELK